MKYKRQYKHSPYTIQSTPNLYVHLSHFKSWSKVNGPTVPNDNNMEGFVLNEIIKLLEDNNNTTVRACGNTIMLKAIWTDKRVNITVNFDSGIIRIVKASSCFLVKEEDAADARKVMLHDPECFNKLQAITNYMLK